jgi:hypothetical protein
LNVFDWNHRIKWPDAVFKAVLMSPIIVVAVFPALIAG